MSVGHERVPLHDWDICRIKDMGDSMAVGCCLEMTMPLFPTSVILELGVVRGTALDAADKGGGFIYGDGDRCHGRSRWCRYNWGCSSRVFVTCNMETIEFPVVEFGFIQGEPNTCIREGKFKIPLLEELNVSNEHRR